MTPSRPWVDTGRTGRGCLHAAPRNATRPLRRRSEDAFLPKSGPRIALPLCGTTSFPARFQPASEAGDFPRGRLQSAARIAKQVAAGRPLHTGASPNGFPTHDPARTRHRVRVRPGFRGPLGALLRARSHRGPDAGTLGAHLPDRHAHQRASRALGGGPPRPLLRAAPEGRRLLEPRRPGPGRGRRCR